MSRSNISRAREAELAKRKYRKRSFAEIDRGPLGTVIFAARRRIGLTQAQLAAAIGRDRPWISDLETAKITFINDEDAANIVARLPITEAELSLRRGGSPHYRSLRVRSTTVVSPPVTNCVVCNHPRELGAHYCGGCGVALALDSICSVCGRPNASTSAFCTQCGGQLSQKFRQP